MHLTSCTVMYMYVGTWQRSPNGFVEPKMYDGTCGSSYLPCSVIICKKRTEPVSGSVDTRKELPSS